jgi:hypothetical protein
LLLSLRLRGLLRRIWLRIWLRLLLLRVLLRRILRWLLLLRVLLRRQASLRRRGRLGIGLGTTPNEHAPEK